MTDFQKLVLKALWAILFQVMHVGCLRILNARSTEMNGVLDELETVSEGE